MTFDNIVQLIPYKTQVKNLRIYFRSDIILIIVAWLCAQRLKTNLPLYVDWLAHWSISKLIFYRKCFSWEFLNKDWVYIWVKCCFLRLLPHFQISLNWSSINYHCTILRARDSLNRQGIHTVSVMNNPHAWRNICGWTLIFKPAFYPQQKHIYKIVVW